MQLEVSISRYSVWMEVSSPVIVLSWNNMKRSIITGLLIMTLAGVVQGQSAKPSIWFGAFGAGSYNMHAGDFQTFDGVQECGQFDNAKTMGWLAGNVLDYVISDPFSLSGRAYYYR